MTIAGSLAASICGQAIQCDAGQTLSMNVRPGTEADLDHIATLTGTAIETARSFLRNRTVRVVESEDRPIGILSYQDDGTVIHITRLVGEADGFEALLTEPIDIAQTEGRTIETIVRDSRDVVRETLETAGFESEGPGPFFEGEPTTWYRYQPEIESR